MPDLKFASKTGFAGKSKIPRAAMGTAQSKTPPQDIEVYRDTTKRWTPLQWKMEYEAEENERRLDEYRRNRARYEMGYRV